MLFEGIEFATSDFSDNCDTTSPQINCVIGAVATIKAWKR